jgi:hypothetical protein
VAADRTRWTILALAWAGFVLAVYCPDIGRGFVKDDFTWIRAARSGLATPSTVVLPKEAGFYRPVVAASFALDYAAHDGRPRGYGWTNVALYVACTMAVGALGLALGFTEWTAALAAFVWAINPHGINMAVVWLSGRTALWLTLFSLLAAIACVKRRFGYMAVAVCLALLSKEEAVALPFVLLAWLWILEHRTIPLRATAAVLIPLVAYFVARALTPAFTPATAPMFYRFTADPAAIARNAGEYLDRSATLAAAVILVVGVIAQRLPDLDDRVRTIAALALTWWSGMFALTMWLPVRSSLYAVCPSVAAAIIAAAVADHMRSRMVNRRWLIEPVLAGLLVAAIPAYQIRNAAWVEGARISQRTLAAIGSQVAALPSQGTIVLRDDDDPISNFRNAFGDLTTEALQTTFGRPWSGVIVAGDEQCPGAILEYRLVGGHVVPQPIARRE